MAEVNALGYSSLRRAWRTELGGQDARSPSQARRSESVRWRTGSLTSPEVGFTPAGDPRGRALLRWRVVPEDRRPTLD
jgi:hypothetical protein